MAEEESLDMEFIFDLLVLETIPVKGGEKKDKEGYETTYKSVMTAKDLAMVLQNIDGHKLTVSVKVQGGSQ